MLAPKIKGKNMTDQNTKWFECPKCREYSLDNEHGECIYNCGYVPVGSPAASESVGSFDEKVDKLIEELYPSYSLYEKERD